MSSLTIQDRERVGVRAAHKAPFTGVCAPYAEEYARLVDAATDVRSLGERTGELGITPLDIVRDVLLNCGGLGNLTSGTARIVASCEKSLSRIIDRRTSVQLPIHAAHNVVNLASTTIVSVDEATALSLHRGLHYLGSPRSGGRHLGLYAKQAHDSHPQLLCLASLHTFDLYHLVPRLVSTDSARRTQVLSRMLALPNALQNAMSRLLGGVFNWVRNHDPSVEMLLTYNNPNLGFLGTVYKATNWQLLGSDDKLPDMTLDGEYISLRELKSRFGSFEFTDLRWRLNGRLQMMAPAKRPLEVYAQRLYRANHTQELTKIPKR